MPKNLGALGAVLAMAGAFAGAGAFGVLPPFSGDPLCTCPLPIKVSRRGRCCGCGRPVKGGRDAHRNGP